MDVYSEWVDACDEVANPKEKTASRSVGAARSSRSRYDGGDNEDDELGGGYGGERSRPAVTGNDDDDDLDDDL